MKATSYSPTWSKLTSFQFLPESLSHEIAMLKSQSNATWNETGWATSVFILKHLRSFTMKKVMGNSVSSCNFIQTINTAVPTHQMSILFKYTCKTGCTLKRLCQLRSGYNYSLTVALLLNPWIRIQALGLNLFKTGKKYKYKHYHAHYFVIFPLNHHDKRSEI